MKQLMTNRILTLINFVIVFYFILLYLINHFKIDSVLIGVFRELMTIPFIFSQLVFLVLGIVFFIKYKPNLLMIISYLFLALSAVTTIGQFFI